ncbi:MAG: DUF1016 N-terminal domain-containing protein [Prevotella sp.]|nr:DUF1016 N-terminal domain-containing protein [Prevotella sp.]
MNNGKEIARIDKVDELQPALQFRSFYLTFSNLEILNTRVQNLSWTHFRSLLRIGNEQERLWYMQEAASKATKARFHRL